MVDIRLSAAALADLNEIDNYGATNFGSQSADLYSRSFGEAFDRLRHFPRSGPIRPELGEGIRMHPVTAASHLLHPERPASADFARYPSRTRRAGS